MHKKRLEPNGTSQQLGSAVEKHQDLSELTARTWISLIESLVRELDDLTNQYANPYIAAVKFELVKHKTLRNAPSTLLRATDNEDLGELKKDIYREKWTDMLILYTSSFLDKFELMHEIESEEKFRILHRRANTAESISKSFFRYVIEAVSVDNATKYEAALEDAERRLIIHELSNPIIAEMLRR